MAILHTDARVAGAINMLFQYCTDDQIREVLESLGQHQSSPTPRDAAAFALTDFFTAGEITALGYQEIP